MKRRTNYRTALFETDPRDQRPFRQENITIIHSAPTGDGECECVMKDGLDRVLWETNREVVVRMSADRMSFFPE